MLVERGAEPFAARYVWDEVQPYYYAPLTPHPDDRLGSEFRVDPDDINDMIQRYAKKVGRKRVTEWKGPDDPTLAEFAIGLEGSSVRP